MTARWKEHESLATMVCYYCGLPGSTIDHFPPQSIVEEYPTVEGWLVRSCQSCNSRLGDSMQPTLYFRRAQARALIEYRIQVFEFFLEGGKLSELIGRDGMALPLSNRNNIYNLYYELIKDFKHFLRGRYTWL